MNQMKKQVAVVGAGKWGQNLIRTFYQLSALDAIVEPHPTTRQQILKRYPDIPVYDSVDLVMKGEVPAIVIATPAETHYQMAQLALQHNKDVYIEKPMTLTSADARSLTEAAKEANRVLMVGHLLLYQPAIEAIRSFLQAGRLGKVYSIHQKRLKLGRVRSFENVLWSFGVHDVAVILHLVGSEPVKLSVSGQSSISLSIEDDVHLHMRFSNGINAHLHTSWLWPKTERRLTIIGSQGMLVYDEIQQSVTLHHKWVDAALEHHDEGCEVIYQGDEEPLLQECQHFLTCIKERRTPLSDGENGIAVVTLLEKATQLLEAEAKE